MTDEWPKSYRWRVLGKRREGVGNKQGIDDPVAWKRPQRNPAGGAYKHSAVERWENLVTLKSKKHAPREPHDGVIMIDLRFWIAIPDSVSNWKTDFLSERGVKKRPDLDNYVKSVLEALEGSFYTDDARVVDLHAVKQGITKPDRPGVSIYLEAYPPYPERKSELENSWWG